LAPSSEAYFFILAISLSTYAAATFLL